MTASVRLACTTSAQVGRMIDALLATGLYGNSRAAVVERLICQALIEDLRQRVVNLEAALAARGEGAQA